MAPPKHGTREIRVETGFATFGPEVLRLVDLLDRCFVAWARASNSEQMQYPALISVQDLAAMDYFQNFPHLGLVVTSIDPQLIGEFYQDKKSSALTNIASDHLCCGDHVLPSAACYNAYVDLKGRSLDKAARITTIANCFRNEAYYDGLKRLKSFRMREIVVVGTAAEAQTHLVAMKANVLRLAADLDLPVDVVVAADPFFDATGPRAKMQKLFPVKEEIVFGGDLAIASLNYHRNFFGERFAITNAENEHAHSACVGMGMERWVHALITRFDGDLKMIEERLMDLSEREHEPAL